MKLSILIPSVPSRLDKVAKLVADLESQITDKPVEVLVFTDNKQRSIGLKRQALLDMAMGEFITFLDDDDEPSSDYVVEILKAAEATADGGTPSIICFYHECYLNGARHIVHTHPQHENEPADRPTFKRRPTVNDVWRREIANWARFPDSSYGEDFAWSEPIIAKMVEPYGFLTIPKILHTYHYEDSKTEAIAVINKTKKKTCVISFAQKGREDYPRHLLRLIDSAKRVGFETDWLVYSPDSAYPEHKGVTIHKGLPGPSLPHSVTPYHFKPHLFQLAMQQGYEQVIWADSTIQFYRHPTKVLDYAATNGYAVYNNLGHPLKYWMADSTAQKLNIPPDELEKCPQIMACVLVFDVTFDWVRDLIHNWTDIGNDGVSFRGDGKNREECKGHRHDQAVLSWLMYKRDLGFLPYGQLAYHPNELDGKYETVFVNKNEGN